MLYLSRQSCLKIRRSEVELVRGLKFTRWQDIKKKEAEEARQELQDRINFKGGLYATKEYPTAVVNREKDYVDLTHEDVGAASYDGVSFLQSLRYIDLSPGHLQRVRRKKQVMERQFDQRFISDRQLLLGPDLAAAHFLVHRGAAVKFLGDDQWYQKSKGLLGQINLPKTKVDGMFIEAIDASQTNLVWEGFDNLNLKHLRFLSVVGCPHVDDWCLNKFHIFAKSLEFLDVSNCPRLSANGISALNCLKKLKFLVLQDLRQIPSIELGKVALMLEESIPALGAVGVNFDDVQRALEREKRLLDNPNVFEDARGNIYVKDRIGEVFYLKGPGLAHEKPLVDEFGLPLMVNRVRRDPPDLPLNEIDELNSLSEGKLKHQLIGSPSGLDHFVETERILAFDAYHTIKNEKCLPEPALIPECMKHPEIKETLFDKVKKFLPIGYEFEVNLPPLTLKQLQEKAMLQLPPGSDTSASLLPESSSNLSQKQISDHDGPSDARSVSALNSSSTVSTTSNDATNSKSTVPNIDKRLQELSTDEELRDVVKSLPPKPRMPRLFSKYLRYNSQ